MFVSLYLQETMATKNWFTPSKLLAIPTYTVIRVFAKEFFNNFRVVQKLTEKI